MSQIITTGYSDLAKKEGLNKTKVERPVVCVQGLGFVGMVMAIATAYSKNNHGSPVYNVIGVELPTAYGLERIAQINNGRLPLNTGDRFILEAFEDTLNGGNLFATTNHQAYSSADFIIVDVGLNLTCQDGRPVVDYSPFVEAIKTIGANCKEGALIVVETTVPPGTCEKIVVPELRKELFKRSIPADNVYIAHSYERVMPGADYLNSLINYWRVYAGTTTTAADKCEEFLSNIINTKDYPLTRLHSTTASETAKVLENAYRATNIAFIEEWGRFAEAVGIDLLEVISAIRIRPTHSNIRQPGFGVGGYCLTKDPLFGLYAAHNLFNLSELDFPFSQMAVETNRVMPLVTADKLRQLFNGNLAGKKVLLLGISYRQDIGDTRNTPAEIFVRALQEENLIFECHDPYLADWPEMKMNILTKLPDPPFYDAIVLAVPHKEYSFINYGSWLKGALHTAIIDANNVLTVEQRKQIRALGNRIISIGRGVGLE